MISGLFLIFFDRLRYFDFSNVNKSINNYRSFLHYIFVCTLSDSA